MIVTDVNLLQVLILSKYHKHHPYGLWGEQNQSTT